MRKASFTNSSYAVEWTVRAVRDTESEPEPPSDDIPVLEMGTLACTESSGLYTSARQSDLIVRDAATALGNASVDVGDTILVGGPQVLKCKAREKTVGGCTKQCDGLHGSQLNPQADGTIICLSAEKDSASMANAARDEYPPIYPTQGIISNAGHSLGDRVPHSPTSWTASGFPTVDTVSNGLSDGIQNGTFEWVPVADGVAQQSLQVKKHMSTSLYQELTHTAEGQTLEDHSPRKRYASAPAADTRYRRGITGSCTPQCIEEPPQLLEIDMLSGCSSPLSTCRSSVVLDWEGDILASQGETNTQITRVNEPPTVDEPSVKNRVSKRLLGLKREAHASMSPHPPAVPSKRTGDWPDQAGDKFEERSERANLEDASSAHQPAHRKRAKKVQAARECGASIGRENQGQVREDLGVNGGSGENSGGETIAVASFPEEQTFSAAKQAQRDGLIAASYDLHSVRKVDGRWLVRNRCDA
ncbi:hypothetical protein FGG08_001286 [Glutinoglossum americanum]|uniref:Uncharacterized protein n=1 Tax=Glutinoglossum americanum TaxID=1670608 RepID=A0A9P8I2E3_9PEZI|nr:hypothetical protein FGG08_001286 [Glutinoglossum americanum]